MLFLSTYTSLSLTAIVKRQIKNIINIFLSIFHSLLVNSYASFSFHIYQHVCISLYSLPPSIKIYVSIPFLPLSMYVCVRAATAAGCHVIADWTNIVFPFWPRADVETLSQCRAKDRDRKSECGREKLLANLDLSVDSHIYIQKCPR